MVAAGQGAGRRAARPGEDRGAPVRRQRTGRRRRHRIGLPAPGRAGGVRAPAGSAGAHGRPAADVQAGRARRGRDGRRGPALVHWRTSVTTSEYDSVRPPEPPASRQAGKAGKRRRRRAARMAGTARARCRWFPSAEFTSYYGRPVVKPAPWGPGIAGVPLPRRRRGRLGRARRRRAAHRAGRRCAATAGWPRWARSAWGPAALVEDLGRPERFLNMLRVIKLTSPMSLGSWILSAFSAGAGVAAVAEVDRMTGERLPLGPLRRVLRAVEGPAGLEAAAFGPLLAVYTAVLLGRHVDSDLEPRARRAALRVRQLGQPGRGRPGDGHDAGGGDGPGPQAGRDRRRRRSGGDPGDAPADGPGRGRAAARRQTGRAAAAERGDSPSRAGSGRCSAADAAASRPRPDWRWWPRRRSPGSGYSRRASAPPRIRATRSSRKNGGSPPAARPASPTIRSPRRAES